jgi:hypothetical protein
MRNDATSILIKFYFACREVGRRPPAAPSMLSALILSRFEGSFPWRVCGPLDAQTWGAAREFCIIAGIHSLNGGGYA